MVKLKHNSTSKEFSWNSHTYLYVFSFFTVIYKHFLYYVALTLHNILNFCCAKVRNAIENAFS